MPKRIIFKTRPFLKLTILFLLICGVCFITALFWNFTTKSPVEIESNIIIGVFVLLIFFVLPFFSYRSLCFWEYENGTWTINYYNKGKTESFDRNAINEIDIVGSLYHKHYVIIKVRLKNGSTAIFNSREMENFNQVLKIFNTDFTDLRVPSKLWDQYQIYYNL